MPWDVRSIRDVLFTLPVLRQPEARPRCAQIIAQMFSANLNGDDPAIFIPTLPDNFHVTLVGAYP